MTLRVVDLTDKWTLLMPDHRSNAIRLRVLRLTFKAGEGTFAIHGLAANQCQQ